METTEKIVESYCRYVKQWFTIPNIKCRGQYEIDLLALDTTKAKKLGRFHIECGVSISGSYSKLTAKDFSEKDLKTRVKAAGQRRTIGYFLYRKFNNPEVLKKLKEYGFTPGNYKKIIVTWGWTPEAKQIADKKNIILWDFRNLIEEIALAHQKRKTYFTDDTARTIQLFAKAVREKRTNK
jgi:hypothetical protein